MKIRFCQVCQLIGVTENSNLYLKEYCQPSLTKQVLQTCSYSVKNEKQKYWVKICLRASN